MRFSELIRTAINKSTTVEAFKASKTIGPNTSTEILDITNLNPEELNLTDECVMDALVVNERIPMLVPARTEKEDIYFAFIPPAGTSRKDSVRDIHGGGKEFYAPDGTSRGLASLQVLSVDEANLVAELRMQSLKKFPSK